MAVMQRFYYTAEQAAEVKRRNKRFLRIITGVFFLMGLTLGIGLGVIICQATYGAL